MKKIGIIAPASACPEGEEEKYHLGVKYLQDSGLEIVLADNIWERDEELGTAGSAQSRLRALEKIWTDESIDLVLSARGGYGCVHVLDKLDYSMFLRYPKPLLGYSDLTALFMSIIKHTDMQCFHSPVMLEFHKAEAATLESFQKLLKLLSNFKKKNLFKNYTRINNAELIFANPLLERVLLENDSCVFAQKNKIIGGNLSIICSLIGTGYLPSFRNKILFLEDCNEPTYKLDRMFNQLRLAGLLNGVPEIWLGKGFEANYPSLENLGIPVITDLPLGHAEVNLSIALN